MIFARGTTAHLALVRVWVFVILIIDLLVDDLPQLTHFPAGAFVRHGFMKLCPEAALQALLTPVGLSTFGWVYGGVLCAGLLGFGRAFLTTGLALVLTGVFQALARGFGGHVNHQELIVLHCLPFLMVGPAYAGFSVNACFPSRTQAANQPDDATAQLMLRCLCFWIMFTYFMIGMARIQTGKWGSYTTPAITFYAYSHSLKWNYWDFSWAVRLMESPASQFFLRANFPLATILELVAPLAVFRVRLVPWIVIALIGFHLMILLFMNIFFWQNLLLLGIPLVGWLVDQPERKGATGRHAVTGRAD